MSVDTTDVVAVDTRNVLAADTADVLSADATDVMLHTQHLPFQEKVNILAPELVVLNFVSFCCRLEAFWFKALPQKTQKKRGFGHVQKTRTQISKTKKHLWERRFVAFFTLLGRFLA